MDKSSTYVPPRVWSWKKGNGGRFANINRPVAGATHEKELPLGRHPLQLYSLATPNGVKVTVMLEELLALGHRGAEYDAWLIRINEGDQFGSGFVALNPNSQIPALQDRRGPAPIRVFESGAILLYLAEKFGAFVPAGGAERAECLSWLFWQMGSGPMLGGGFVLALGGFFAALAAVDTANPYGPIGASRTRMVGFLAEPVFMIVFFTVSFVAGSTIPYIVQQKWVTPIANFFAPSHVLLVLAFLMLILAEGGRIPVDNPSGHFELAMIDESKSLEYSGRGFALMKWGGQMKFFVLLCIFLHVLVSPGGLAKGQAFAEVLLAIPLVLLKIFCFVLVLVFVESSLSKLRLFRITEFLGAAFVTSVVAMIAQVFFA